MVVAWCALALLVGLALGEASVVGSLTAPPAVLVLAGCCACLLGGWLAHQRLLGMATGLLLTAAFVRALGAAPVLTGGDVAFHTGQVTIVQGVVAAEPDVRDS